MRSWPLTFVIIGFLIIISSFIIFDPPGGDNTNSQTSCKDTSETVDGYRLCLALEKCHDEFRDNSALRQDCLENVFYEALK